MVYFADGSIHFNTTCAISQIGAVSQSNKITENPFFVGILFII